MWIKVDASGQIVDTCRKVRERAQEDVIGKRCTRFASAPAPYIAHCKRKAREGGEVPAVLSFGDRPISGRFDYRPREDGTCLGKLEVQGRHIQSPLVQTDAGLWCLKGDAEQRVAIGVEKGYERRWLRAKSWAQRNYGEMRVEEAGPVKWAVSRAAENQRDLAIRSCKHDY